MKKEINSYLFLALLIFWSLLVILGYYYFHKPINISQAKTISASVINVSIASGIVILAGGIGQTFYSNKSLTPVEELVIQAVFGFGLFSLTWLLIGITIGYKIWISWSFFVLCLIFFRKTISSWTLKLISSFRNHPPIALFDWLLIVFISILLFNQLVIALSPPISWDSLMYHLEIPRQYLLAGKFHFLPENFYWGQPQLTELLYSFCGSLFMWETATTLNFLMVLLFGIGIYGSISNISKSAALVSVLSLLVGETFRHAMHSGYVDGVSGLFGYAILVIIYNSIKNRNFNQFSWIGVLLGLAVWVKLTNIILFPIVLISILVVNIWHQEAWWKGIRAILIGLLVFLPWLIILYVFTGNPFYPHIFETSWVNSLRYQFFQADGTTPGLSFLWLPVALTWHGLHVVYIEGKLIFATDIGPLLLGLGGIGLITKVKEKKVIISSIWLFLGWILMLLGGTISNLLWQTRLYYSLIAPAAFLVGYGWDYISQFIVKNIRPRKIFGALIILISALTLTKDLDSTYSKDSYKVIIGSISRDTYLNRNLGAYYSVSQELAKLPQSANVLLLWEPRGFYMPENVRADVWIDHWYLTAHRYSTSSEILSYWKQKGFTHLVINTNGMEYEKQTNDKYDDRDWDLLDQTLDNLHPPLLTVQEYLLYTLDK